LAILSGQGQKISTSKRAPKICKIISRLMQVCSQPAMLEEGAKQKLGGGFAIKVPKLFIKHLVRKLP